MLWFTRIKPSATYASYLHLVSGPTAKAAGVGDAGGGNINASIRMAFMCETPRRALWELWQDDAYTWACWPMTFWPVFGLLVHTPFATTSYNCLLAPSCQFRHYPKGSHPDKQWPSPCLDHKKWRAQTYHVMGSHLEGLTQEHEQI